MKRKEFDNLILEWKNYLLLEEIYSNLEDKVLEEGLNDDDIEYLLSEGFLSDLGKKLGRKTKNSITGLTMLASLSGAISQADAYPTDAGHRAAYETVVDDTMQHFNKDRKEVEKYKENLESISIDKTLSVLYYMHQIQMKDVKLEAANKLSKIFVLMKEKIKKDKSGRYYLPNSEYDKFAEIEPVIFSKAAKAASQVSAVQYGDNPLDTSGALLIMSTDFEQ